MTHPDPFDTLPPHLAALARKRVAEREMDCCNVHFVNEAGERDRFSFATVERADAFRRRLAAAGRPILSGATLWRRRRAMPASSTHR